MYVAMKYWKWLFWIKSKVLTKNCLSVLAGGSEFQYEIGKWLVEWQAYIQKDLNALVRLYKGLLVNNWGKLVVIKQAVK